MAQGRELGADGERHMSMNPRLPLRLVVLLLATLLAAAACASSTEITAATGVANEPTPEPVAEPSPTRPPEPTAVPVAATHTVDEEEVDEPDAGAGVTLAMLIDAELAWVRSGVVDYRYTLRQSCECDDDQRRPRNVIVSAGHVEVATDQGTPTAFEGYSAEQLFDAARAALRRGRQVEMRFAANGFPVGGVIDVEATWVDGGFTYDTTEFEVVDEGPPVDDDFMTALQRWRTSDLDDYVMTYRRVCFCPVVDVTVTVVDGTITEVVGSSGVEIVPLTVDDLFDAIRHATNARAYAINAEYDPTVGRPVSIYIDQDPQIADEEFGYEVTSFEATDRPTDPGPQQVPPAELAEFCGALAAIEAIDDPPETAMQARELLAELVRLGEVVVAAAPPDLTNGATEFTSFLAAVSELAAANDWDPDLFTDLDDEVFANYDLSFDVLTEFFATTADRCNS